MGHVLLCTLIDAPMTIARAYRIRRCALLHAYADLTRRAILYPMSEDNRHSNAAIPVLQNTFSYVFCVSKYVTVYVFFEIIHVKKSSQKL